MSTYMAVWLLCCWAAFDPACANLQADPGMANFMQSMNNPSYRDDINQKLQDLKKDPELADIMKEIEEGGPAAMQK